MIKSESSKPINESHKGVFELEEKGSLASSR